MSTSIEKKKLMAQSELYKDEFERELKVLKYQTNEILKNTLIIGGSLAVTYILFRQFTSKKRKKRAAATALIKNEESEQQTEITTFEQPSQFASIVSNIGTTLANEATYFLLNLAKEKLFELLTPKETNQAPDEDDS